VNANHETQAAAPAYLTAIEGILEQRQEAEARERTVIEGLNEALAKLGYKIVPLRGGTKPQSLVGRSTDPGFNDTPKRRGRPPKAKVDTA
jgi:hypothetical protein